MGNPGRRCALLLAFVSLLQVMPTGAYADWWYRHIKPAPNSLPAKPAQVPISSVKWWALAGKASLKSNTKLIDLGLSSHASIIVNGTLLGDSPFAYWATGPESTVANLCAKIYTLPGKWDCTVKTSFTGTGYLWVEKYSDFETPLDFVYANYGENTQNPVQLFGGAVPDIAYRNTYGPITDTPAP